jgi:hypothetical protein
MTPSSSPLAHCHQLTGVTPLHLWPVLWVRPKSQPPPALTRKELHQGTEPRDWKSLVVGSGSVITKGMSSKPTMATLTHLQHVFIEYFQLSTKVLRVVIPFLSNSTVFIPGKRGKGQC